MSKDRAAHSKREDQPGTVEHLIRQFKELGVKYLPALKNLIEEQQRRDEQWFDFPLNTPFHSPAVEKVLAEARNIFGADSARVGEYTNAAGYISIVAAAGYPPAQASYPSIQISAEHINKILRVLNKTLEEKAEKEASLSSHVENLSKPAATTQKGKNYPPLFHRLEELLHPDNTGRIAFFDHEITMSAEKADNAGFDLIKETISRLLPVIQSERKYMEAADKRDAVDPASSFFTETALLRKRLGAARSVINHDLREFTTQYRKNHEDDFKKHAFYKYRNEEFHVAEIQQWLEDTIDAINMIPHDITSYKRRMNRAAQRDGENRAERG